MFCISFYTVQTSLAEVFVFIGQRRRNSDKRPLFKAQSKAPCVRGYMDLSASDAATYPKVCFCNIKSNEKVLLIMWNATGECEGYVCESPSGFCGRFWAAGRVQPPLEGARPQRTALPQAWGCAQQGQKIFTSIW